MRRLLLLRHAKAERSQPGQRDRDRRLADRGRRDAPVIGGYLRTQNLIPDAVAVSPATRTRETWDLIAKAFQDLPDPAWDERLYDATPDDILAVIQDTPPKAGTLLVIGHNPGLYELAVWLIASGHADAQDRLTEALPTAGLAAIEFTADAWTKLRPQSGRLERFVTPRSLAAAAD